MTTSPHEATQEWAEAASAQLGVDWDEAYAPVLLDLAARVQEDVGAADAGTVAAFLLGMAVGHGHPVRGAAVRLLDLDPGSG